MDLHTILKPHIGTKMCRLKFSFISVKSHPPTLSSAYAKTKSPIIKVLAPFLDPSLAKIKNESTEYIKPLLHTNMRSSNLVVNYDFELDDVTGKNRKI